MLRNLKVEYQKPIPTELPIQKATFNLSGGMDTTVMLNWDKSRCCIDVEPLIGGTVHSTYTKDDLGEYIKLLQRFHDAM